MSRGELVSPSENCVGPDSSLTSQVPLHPSGWQGHTQAKSNQASGRLFGWSPICIWSGPTSNGDGKYKVKNWFMLSVRISSYGCTREVWRARKKRKSCSRR